VPLITACAIDGGARNVIGESRREPTGTGDIPGLGADLIDAAEDHVIDLARVHPGALHERVDGMRAQIGGMYARQGSFLLAGRTAHRADDVRLVAHG
jgi:hypothetical protein